MPEAVAQLAVISVALFGIYVIASLGFLLVYIPAKFFNFFAAIPIVAAPYLARVIADVSGSLVVGCVAALSAVGALGAASYWLFFRRLAAAGYPATIQLVATLGAYTATVGLIGLLCGQQSLRLAGRGSEVLELAGHVYMTGAQLLSVVIAAGVIVAVTTVWRGTQIGLKLRAITDDLRLASIVRIPVARYATWAFASGFGLLGVAGILSGLDAAIRPTFAFPVIVVAMVAAAIGRGGHRLTAAIGASALVAIAETIVAWFAGEAWARAVSLIALVVIVAIGGSRRGIDIRKA
jgi:branched-chain amino acid transport system permease protein